MAALSGLTPVPGCICFVRAWDRAPEQQQHSLLVRLILLFPTVVVPPTLLWAHSMESNLSWQVHGDFWLWYIALDDCAKLYLLPFAGANGLIGVAIIHPDFQKDNLLIRLALIACIVICVFFTLGNLHRELFWIYPASCCLSYAAGYHARAKIDKWPEWQFVHILMLVVSVIGTVLTAIANIALARQLVARLPAEPPDNCFVVSAAARGHRSVVGSWWDGRSGEINSQQLQTFRRFEAWLIATTPAFHRRLRQTYNIIGPLVARLIVFRWQADIVYFTLKPLELLVRRISG